MDKSSKKILYNIFDINNNINTEININRENTQQNSLKLSIKNNIKNNNRKDIKYRNKTNMNMNNKGNYFYSYNNIINNYPIKPTSNLEKEKIPVSGIKELNLNKIQKYSKGYPLTYRSSNSYKKRNVLLNMDENLLDEDEILSMKYNEVKKLHKLFDENILLKKEIKQLKEEIESIKNINKANIELINSKSSELYTINENTQKLKQKMNELYKTINDNNSIISRLNEEKIYLEKELILTKKDIIKKNDELDRLTDECRNLQIKINENNIKSKNKALNISNNNEINFLNNKGENFKDKNKKLNSNNNLLLSLSEENNSPIKRIESKKINLSEKLNESFKSKIKPRNKIKNNSGLKSLDSLEIVENLEIKSRIPSTPSFKSLKSKESNKDSKEDLFEIKNEIKESNKNNINNEGLDIKYYQNKYLYYFKLYQEIKKNNEILQKEKKEKEDLNKKLK